MSTHGAAIKKAMTALGLSVMLVGVSACGGGGSGTSEASGGTDDAAASAAQAKVDAALEPVTDLGLSEPLKQAPEKGKLAYLIRFSNEGSAAYEAWPEVTDVVGWDGKVIAVDGNDPQGGTNAIKQAISAGADYITLNANSVDGVAPGLEAARAADVPVFFLSGIGEVEGEKNWLFGNVGDLNGIVKLSMPILEWAIADSKGVGDVLYVNLPDVPILAGAEKQIETQFAQECPKCTYHPLEVSTDQLVNGDIVDSVVSELRKNPKIKWVTTTLSATAIGLRSALDTAGLNDVKIGVASPSDAQFDDVRQGDIDVISAYGVPEGSYAGLDQMLRLDQDMDVLQSEHASRPFQLYNADTIGDTKTFDGPQGFEDLYRDLWKLN